MAGQRPIQASRINWQHSMTTQGTIQFWGFSPPGGPFRGGAPSHDKVNVMSSIFDARYK